MSKGFMSIARVEPHNQMKVTGGFVAEVMKAKHLSTFSQLTGNTISYESCNAVSKSVDGMVL